ncbi:MAG: IPT/TIG domain-containing protein, partial [Sphingobacterium sp.]
GYPLKEVEVLKIEDTKLLLKIPTNLAKHENRVDLYINQNLDNLYIDPDLGLAHLKILGKIDFLADKPIYFGDGLRIRSYGLESYFSNFPIYVGNSTFSYYGDQIPLEGIDFTDKKLKLSYFNGQDTIFYEHKLELIKPQPSDLLINQSNFHPGQPFTLSSDLLYKFYGEYNLDIKIDDKVYNSSLHQMATDATYFIPILKQGKYDVEVLSKLYPPVKLRNALDVRPISPKIDPKPYYYNDVIEVSGNFISGVNYYAKLEEFEIFSGQAKGGKLQMTLPYGKFGVQDLLIGAEGSDQVILDLESVPLEIKGGLIESISPLSAYSGDIITIKGRGFDAATGVWIRVADLECKLVSQTKTEIKFLAPNSVRKGKFPVHIEFIFGHDVIESKQLLELK